MLFLRTLLSQSGAQPVSLAGMCPHCLWALPAGFSLPGRKGSHGLTVEETCLVGELLLLTGPGDLVEMWGFAALDAESPGSVLGTSVALLCSSVAVALQGTGELCVVWVLLLP